jgi:uncharacterized membrane protein YphA (DoxX/SURF4 family)
MVQVTALRLVVGIAWIAAGLAKVRNPAWEATFALMLQHWATGNGSISHAIDAWILPNIRALSLGLEVAEFLIGAFLITGFLAQLAALGGFLIVAAAWVFKQSYMSIAGYADGNFILMMTMLFLTFMPTGPFRLGRRRPVKAPAQSPSDPLADAWDRLRTAEERASEAKR